MKCPWRVPTFRKDTIPCHQHKRCAMRLIPSNSILSDLNFHTGFQCRTPPGTSLLQETLSTLPADTMTYQDAFLTYLNIDPLSASNDELLTAMKQQGIDIHEPENLSFDSKLQLLFSYVIEPQIGSDKPCFIYNFPASQAALAKLSATDPRVAERFEVYFKGAELANGFNELSAAKEQRVRFESDNDKRRASGLVTKPIDENFLNALEVGLPLCAGVALGVDRLLMLKTGANHINEVINFTVSRA
mgnify:CR=1 FL=1